MVNIILLIMLLFTGVAEAQVTPAIAQKGNNVRTPGLSNIGVLPCVATAVDPVYTEGFQVGCSVRLNGLMRVDTGGGGGGTSSTFGAAFPATGTASGWFDGTNMQGARVFDLDTGGGTQYVAGSTLRCSAVGGSTECLPATAIDADGIVNQTSTYMHGMGYMYNGATWDRLRGTIAGGLLVDVSDAFLLDTTFTTRINTLGQKTMVNSTPVVIASDQSSIPITVAALPLPAGAATEATLATRLADATFTGRFTVAYIDADAIVNQTTTAMHGQCYLFNGATWDRCRGSIASGLLVNVSNTFLLDATFTGRFPVAVADADATATQTSSFIHGYCYLFNGATWDRCRGTVTGGMFHNLVQLGSTTLVSGGVAGTLGVGGVSANNTAITQNPVLIACETIAQGTQPTAATAANQRRTLCTTEGSQFVQEGSSNRFSCFVQAVTVTTQCQAAPAAGLRAYVTSVSLSNQVATVQTLDIVFGTGANCVTGITALTHKWQFGTAAITTSPFVVSQQFLTPLIPTAANAICVRPSAATAFGATLTGFVAP